MIKKRIGKYPNATDFDTYIHRPVLDEATHYELPLSDPSETSPADAYQARELSSDHHSPSAFSVNRKNNLKTTS